MNYVKPILFLGLLVAGDLWFQRRHSEFSVPSSATQWAPRLQTGMQADNYLQLVVAIDRNQGTLAENEPITFLIRKWKTETNVDAKGRLQLEIESRMSSENARTMVQILAPDFSTTSLALNALRRWVEIAPAEAMAWAQTNAQIDRLQLDVIVGGWLGQERGQLAHFIGTLPKGEWRNAVLEAASRAALQSNLVQDAAAWFMQIPSTLRSEDMMEAIATLWGEKDFASASSWIMAQDDPHLQDRLLANMLGGYARLNPSSAAQFAQNIFESGEALNRAAEVIVPIWLKVDAGSAADWIASVSDPEVRAHAFDLLFPAWLAADAGMARNWVLAQPLNSERNDSLNRIVQWAAQNNPAIAGELLGNVSPNELRESVRIGIMRQWARWDFSKASAWANQLPPGLLRTQAMTALSNAASEPSGIPF